MLLGNPHCDTTLELKNHSSILRKEILLSGVWNSYYEELPLNEWSYSVEMLESENPLTNLMAGIIKLHVYMTPPSPAQEIDFVLEYDASYVTSALQG